MQEPPAPIVHLSSLQNTFYLLRHGHSVANQQQLIVSNPVVGLHRFGLTDIGTQQVQSNLAAMKGPLHDVTRIISSDFLRTHQTATIASSMLGAPVELSHRLRERDFGDFDGQSNEHYQRVWNQDAHDAAQRRWNVESVESVAARMCGLVQEIERSTIGKKILLVSHGDPLQILITATSGVDLRLHRQLDSMQTAEVRLLSVGRHEGNDLPASDQSG